MRRPLLIRGHGGTGLFKRATSVQKSFRFESNLPLHNADSLSARSRLGLGHGGYGILRRDAHSCQYCSAKATTLDHVVPRCQGGPSTWTNLVACCLPCNQRKGGRTPEQAGTFSSPYQNKGSSNWATLLVLSFESGSGAQI